MRTGTVKIATITKKENETDGTKSDNTINESPRIDFVFDVPPCIHVYDAAKIKSDIPWNKSSIIYMDIS